jgi:hypothetical protein
MLTGTTYRGVHLQRLLANREWTELWLVGHGARLFTWNAALAWIDELMEDDDLPKQWPPHICSDCGKRDLLEWIPEVRVQLLELGICHSCLHWVDVLRDMCRILSRTFVAEGTAYTIGRAYKGGGFGGSHFTVQWLDTDGEPTGRVQETCNLWHRGPVPGHWRERLPDTARLLP